MQNIDTTAIGLILAGLARCGAWACLDEFNRLQASFTLFPIYITNIHFPIIYLYYRNNRGVVSTAAI